MKKYIRIWGMERTFTNYMEALIDRNVRNVETVQDLCWKHGRTMFAEYRYNRDGESIKELLQAYDQGRMYHIVCTKNPYAWIVSFIKGLRKGICHEKNYKHPDADILDDWIRDDRDYKEHLDDPNYLKQYVRKYNIRHRQWYRMLEVDEGITLRYEDLLGDEKLRVNVFCRWWDMEVEPEFSTPSNWMDTDGTERDQDFDPTYYTEKRYLNDLTKNQREAVEEGIDWSFVSSYLGYQKGE